MRCGHLALISAIAIVRVEAAIATPPPPTLGDVKAQHGAIVLATLRDVREVSGPEEGHGHGAKGYAFRLEIDEVLWGEVGKNIKQIEVPFSGRGREGDWGPREAEPRDGTKVLAHLMWRPDGLWELFPRSDAIGVVGEHTQPYLSELRKIIALWRIRDDAERLKAVKAGLSDPDMEFRLSCIYILDRPGLNGMGVDLSQVLTREAAQSLIWDVYTRRGEPLVIVQKCDGVFGNRFRGLGWTSHPARYPIIFDAVKRHIPDEKEIRQNTFIYALRDLSAYPEHAGETYRLMIEVLEMHDDRYKFGTVANLSYIYHPYTKNQELAELNEKIWAKLVELLAHQNRGLAAGAAIAIGRVSLEQAVWGRVDEKIMAVLRGEEPPAVAEAARSRLRRYLREVESTQQAAVKRGFAVEGADILSQPWEAHLGRTVVAYGYMDHSYPGKGASMRVRGRRLWLEDIDPRRDGIRSDQPLVVSGVLAKVCDLPVFQYQPGKPFGEGLPVPEGFDAEDVATRYVLTDPSWESVEDPNSPTR